MTAEPKSAPKWIRILRVTWAALLIAALAFSILMAAWGDLRESLLLRVLDDRHAKSFLLQFPEGTRVWIGDLSLDQARKHPLAQGEPDDSADAVEGLRVVLPRVYLTEHQLREQSVDWPSGERVASVLERVAPGAELVAMLDRPPGGNGFTQIVLGRDGKLDALILGAIVLPSADGKTERLGFLLRAGSEEQRVFRFEREELWSDRLWAPQGQFWAQREQYDGMPPAFTGQVKTVWRWYFAAEEDETAWRATLPEKWADAPWADLPASD
jgi:hypothetical protein